MSLKHIFATSLYLSFWSIWAIAQSPSTLVLRGTVVTPTEIFSDGIVSISGSKIVSVGQFVESASQTNVLETDSFIYPGLIDLHNHITWNLLPRWKPPREFGNRYEWLQLNGYKIALDTPHRKLFEEGFSCHANLYGEVKAIIGGATSVVGSLSPSKPGSNDNRCIMGFVRNLDYYSGFYGQEEINSERLRYEVFPFEMRFDDAAKVRLDLEAGRLSAFLIHVGEGKPTDANAAREFRMLERQGFLRRGVSIIHGVAFGRGEFQKMAAQQVGLIWSPRSNVELYGSTADVALAKQEGVRIALSPDWSPSGSDGILSELKFAATWNAGQAPAVFDDSELVKMVTVYPAQLAGLSDKIGTLKAGLYADLLLIRKNGTNAKSGANAYATLVHSSPGDVRLVMINGTPVYGDVDLMRAISHDGQLESISVCGKNKLLHIESDGFAKSLSEVLESLKLRLTKWGVGLAPLIDCQ